MNWKIFISTFALIFIAELGDKTQLAAMARATTSESAKWTVFAAAASALVLSTLIAVLLGSALTKVVPERYIKIGAGIMFIVFGIIILWRTFLPPEEKTSDVRPVIGHAILKLASEFEKAAFQDYRAIAEKVTSPQLKALLEKLAREEQGHLEQILQKDLGPGLSEVPEDHPLVTTEGLKHDVTKSDSPMLEHAIEHEEATAGFYAELAELTPLPPLKRTFRALAREERTHAEQLRSFIGASDNRNV